MKYLRNICYTLLALIAVVFIIQNYEQFSHKFSIMLNLYVFQFETIAIQAWVLFLISFFIGVLLTSIASFMERTRLKSDLRQCRKEIDRLKAELSSLRNLPIVEAPVATSSNHREKNGEGSLGSFTV